MNSPQDKTGAENKKELQSLRSKKFGAAEGDEGIIRCDACPVLCRIRPGRSGACARYANEDGLLIRTDPVVLLEKAIEHGDPVVSFAHKSEDWDGTLLDPARVFVTGIGAGTTYPDYKPAPFIVSQEYDGIDTVTVVTEGIFSYCGVKVKIDTDRHLGAETATIRCGGEQVGHVTTAEYGSQMLSLGGVRHLTGGSKKEGNVTCETLLKLCNGEAVELVIEGGHTVLVQAGKAPIVDGIAERRMRVGCGSATVGIFAKQWLGHVDEVIVLDDHITGVLTEHQAGRVLGMRSAGIRVKGRKSTPGRYFQVANPGMGWGGTDITDPLSIIQRIDPSLAWPGLRLLLTSTTGEDALWCVLDETLTPVPAEMPEAVRAVVNRIGENCEPSVCTVLFMAGAGGSLRAGVTSNPVLLTRSVQDGTTRVTLGGAPAMLWPGGGITIMVDVTLLPKNAFGSVPTPALVAPIEFILPRSLYESSGGHSNEITPVEAIIRSYGHSARIEALPASRPWPLKP
jgi:6-hydroxynicotinate reductase